MGISKKNHAKKLTILEEIVAKRKKSFPANVSVETLEKTRPFYSSLSSPSKWALIAEIKASSPSKGTLLSHPNPKEWALRYERAGVHAISVVTEENYFHGDPKWIQQVKQVSKLPVLRKDFLATPEEILESRVLGADAVLLIAAILKGNLLEKLVLKALGLNLEPLVEIHTIEEAKRALKTKTRLIGINNRNLHDFSVSLETTKKIAPFIKGENPNIVLVSESGIFSSKEIKELYPFGVKGFLVGEAILTSRKPEEILADLLGKHA